MDLLKCISSVLGHSYAGRRFIGCKNMINATFYTFNCQLPTGCTIRVKVYASDLWQLSHPLFFMHSSNTEVQYEERRRVDHFFKNKNILSLLIYFRSCHEQLNQNIFFSLITNLLPKEPRSSC